MPRHHSSQFLEQMFALIQGGRDVCNLASELRNVAATIYRWQRQARTDAGDIVGENSAMALELADTNRRIRDVAEELTAPKLATSMVKDDGIRPKGASRFLKP